MVTRKLVAILVVALFFSSLSFAVTDDERAQAVLTKAADILDWPDTVTSNTNESEGTGRSYTITDTGESSGEVSATIVVFGTEQEPQFWMKFIDQELDVVHTSYQGRDAEISTMGENCNPKPLPKMFNDMFNGFFEDIFGPSTDEKKGCVTDTGTIMWTCGDYIFTASDDSTDPDKAGREKEAAAALYTAAEQAGLCEYGDTLVIMADTPDKSGDADLPTIAQRTQDVNGYYGVNAMGQQPPFKFSFMKPSATDDWYTLDNPMSSYHFLANNQYGEDAIKKAFDGADVPQDLYFERIVVVYPGLGWQRDKRAPLATANTYGDDSNNQEVAAAQGTRKIYYKNLILVSETDQVGLWAHEFGHSLTSKYKNGQFYRISDRYNYAVNTDPDRQFGDAGKWDLMASGNWWGDYGTLPTQMSSFTKYAAGWLTYRDAALNNSYTLTALENMHAGDAALRFDDPTSTNPENYGIAEARDSTGPYGAPASGVELYQVKWDSTYGHHVVNAMNTHSGLKTISTANGNYQTPTLYAADPSPGSQYLIPPWQMKITVTAVTHQPFTATVKLEPYNPTNLVGATLHPGPTTVRGAGGPTTNANALDSDPMPNMDLHAYDAQGNHVGMNYQTGQYEDNIPGAISSGNLVGDDQWIFVPAGTQVRYEVSTERTKEFLTNHPDFASSATPQNYSATAIKFDANGNRFEADLGSGNADAGANLSITSPDDPSLQYKPVTIPGYGNNSNQLCPLLPGFIIFLLGGFLWKKCGKR